jgi:hypothetical protein
MTIGKFLITLLPNRQTDAANRKNFLRKEKKNLFLN